MTHPFHWQPWGLGEWNRFFYNSTIWLFRKSNLSSIRRGKGNQIIFSWIVSHSVDHDAVWNHSQTMQKKWSLLFIDSWCRRCLLILSFFFLMILTFDTTIVYTIPEYWQKKIALRAIYNPCLHFVNPISLTHQIHLCMQILLSDLDIDSGIQVGLHQDNFSTEYLKAEMAY